MHIGLILTICWGLITLSFILTIPIGHILKLEYETFEKVVLGYGATTWAIITLLYMFVALPICLNISPL